MSSRAFWRVSALILIAAAALAGGVWGGRASGGAQGAGASASATYREALAVVRENYAGEVDYEKANEAAVQGMLWALDPHSNFFTPGEYQRLLQDQESRFTGIGVQILRRRDGVYVQTPLPGTPAAKAGLRFGDRIVEVDGRDAREWTTQEVSKAVRGPEGQRVTIKVERAGSEAPLFFTIVRGSVPQPSIRNAFMARPGVGYVGLTGGFTHTTGEELTAALESLGRQGMRQLVLDVRNNPGGLLNESIEVTSRFVARNLPIVSVRGRQRGSAREYKNNLYDPVDYPLVVLINRNSASASEIVAGAVQDHARGLVVGETSFGKGLVQKVFQLPHGAGLTLTTAKYYTPYGRLIQRDYSNGSIYDYYVRLDPVAGPTPQTPLQPTRATEPLDALPQPTPQPTPMPTPTGPAVSTAGGRVFYGGGGITPDHEVKPRDVNSPARARIFEETFHFVRALAGGQVRGFEAYRLNSGPRFEDYPRADELPVTDALVAAFRDFARRDPQSGLTVAQIDAEAEYVRLRLREEIVTAAYGGDAAGRFLLESDPQLLRALELLPEARALFETTGRNVVAGG
ncbi:MAG TPA: S41 family peptidase [Pyrinomonadaceae bacterium]|nr:S41 family peptidase [Pyrinomonadaceae bacterium]